MTDFQSPETSGIVSQSSGAILPLDDLKSFFYCLNAKPDTELRLLPSGKTLELADIRSLNEQIAAKLSNHDITANITSINFILSNKRIKDYSTWAEFERENWNTVNERVLTLSINWDILIKLPQYKLPQRHSMKLRIGTAIPPKDIFQLLLTSDNISELMETGATGVCKVDFVNHIIAIELLNIVSNWYEGLKESQELNPVQKFLKKQGELLSEIIRSAAPILLLVITYLYSNYLFPILGISEEISINNLQKVFILLAAVFVAGSFSGRKIERFIDRKIGKFEEYPKFSITRGDRKAIEEFEKGNERLTRQITSRIFWIVFSILITFLLKLLIHYIIPPESSP